MNTNKTGNSGGPSNQKGVLFQNEIGASYLFDLLSARNGIKSVAFETTDPVDDIVIHRVGEMPIYYQAKSTDQVTKWTVAELNNRGVLAQFLRQQRTSGKECELVVATVAAPGPMVDLSKVAREHPSLAEFLEKVLALNLRKEWEALCSHNPDGEGPVGELDAFDLLRLYREESWPRSPEQVRDVCRGRHTKSPMGDHFDLIWALLQSYVAEAAVAGDVITRPLLLEWLRQRGATFLGIEDTGFDVNDTREAAGPEWYVNRDEESDVLARLNGLALGAAGNLLVMGEGGAGKSSFYKWLNREVGQDERFTLASVSAEGGEPSELLGVIFDEIKTKSGLTLPSPSPPPPLQVERLYRLVSHARSKNTRIVVAVDHVESLFAALDVDEARNLIHKAQRNFFAAIRRTTTLGNIAWILFARTEHYFLMFPSQDDQLALRFDWVCLGEFEPQAARVLLDRLCKLAGRTFEDQAIPLFLSRVPPSPQKIVLSFLNTLSRCEDAVITREHLERFRPWEEVFEREYLSLTSDEQLLTYAIASLMIEGPRRSFSVDEIHETLSRIAEAPWTKERVSQVLYTLQVDYRIILQTRKNHFSLYHLNFASYVIGRNAGITRTAKSEEQFGNFVDYLSHELANPLHGIRAIAEHSTMKASREPLTNQTWHKKMEDVFALASAAAQTLANARVLRSAASGGVPPARLDAIDLMKIAHRVWAMVKPRMAPAENRTFRIQCSTSSEKYYAAGDEGLVSSALYNVIDNAIKYSYPNSAIEVSFGVGHHGKVWMTDTNLGVGLTAQEIQSAFDKASRGSRAQAVAMGSGMGLHIVSQIMRAIGGRASIHSTPTGERGDVIRVTLEFQPPDKHLLPNRSHGSPVDR